MRTKWMQTTSSSMLHEDEAIDKTSHNDSTVRSELSSVSAGGTAEERELSERTI